MTEGSILSREDVLQAVREKIAGDVVAKLDDKFKTQIIMEAVAEIVGGYDFKRVMEKEMQKLACHKMIDHLSRPDVQARLKEAAVVAVEKFIGEFAPAMLRMLYQSAGVVKSSGYDSSIDTDIGKAIARQLGLDKK